MRTIDRTEAAAPELAAFAKAISAGNDPEAAYRSFKGKQVYQPRFYLEAARILFAKQHAALARRVLSNLVESRPGDVSALRSYAYWLAEFGQAAEADAVLRAVSGEDPAALPVMLDRASIHATNGDLAAAADALSDFFDQLPACQSGSLAAVALTEFNALPPVPTDPFGSHPLGGREGNYQQNLAADIRIVVSSTGDDNTLNLGVTEPGGFVCSPAGSPTPCGGQITAAGNLREYMIRRAVPGTYQINCSSDQAATVRAVIHTNWGRPNHTCKVVTLLVDDRNSHEVGEVDFEAIQGPTLRP